VCKYTTEAIITEGSDVGTVHKVCANRSCPVHHPKSKPAARMRSGRPSRRSSAKRPRKETAVANATGIHVLAAIAAAVPVRLMKRDLLFVVERLSSLLDENLLSVLAKQHGIRRAKDSDPLGKLFAAYLRRTEESMLDRVLVELTILHAASRQNTV
jgi:ParB family transcriptional regulator, chromosome partitioning protein